MTEKKEVPSWVSSLGGGLGAWCGAVVTSPLEVIKTRLQAQYHKAQLQTKTRLGMGTLASLRNLVVQEGFFGLYRGLGSHCLGVVPARAIHFFVYSSCKKYFGKRWDNHPYFVPIVSSSSAAITVVTITSPIWLVKTRLQLQVKDSAETLYNGMWDCAKKTYQKEGVKGFYRGLSASYLGGVFETMIQFTLYENFKLFFQKEFGRKELHSYEYLTLSSCAKLIASAITYPHEVIRTRLREQKTVVKYKGPISGMILLGREEGRKGLYGGMGAHLLKVVPNAAILFYVYELTENFYLTRQERKHHTTSEE